MKFKIGDRVRAIRAHDLNNNIVGKIGRVVSKLDEDNEVGVAFDEYISGHCCDGSVTDGHGWYVDVNCLELVEDDETIVIYRKGNEVVALDKRTGKKAIAKCSPDDTFDFNVGAKLAFERLTKTVTFRLLCVAENYITRIVKMSKGKVYEFVDGRTTYDNGNASSLYSSYEDFRKNNDSLSKCCVELKDGDDPVEMLKKYDREIRVGDRVKVTNTGKVHSTSLSYFKDNNVPYDIACRYAYGEGLGFHKGIRELRELFEVVFAADNRVVIKRDNGKCYLIHCDGVEKC